MRLQEMKWPDVQRYLEKDDLILIPVGATEQHGTHLPLGTDSYESIAWAEAAARRTEVIVAPPLWYGWSPHHMCHPGTLTLSADTLSRVVYELCQSVVYHGFSKIIIVNGHRETNLPPLKIAATRVANDVGARVVVVDPGYMGGAVAREMRQAALDGVGHADELETSFILHVCGESLVDVAEARQTNVRRTPGQNPSDNADRPYRPLVIDELKALTSPTGALGNPSQASAEKGRRYHEALVESLVTLIRELREETVTTTKRAIPV